MCINDKDRPAEIELEKWPKFGEEYTMTYLYYHPMQGVQGVELKELKLTEDNYPYEVYKLSRFAIHKDDAVKFKEMMKNWVDMSEVDINGLLDIDSV
jgi:hypothetical protein